MLVLFKFSNGFWCLFKLHAKHPHLSPCCCQLFRSARWSSKEASLHNSQWWHNSQQYLQIPAKITVLWLVTPCSFVDGNPRLGRLYCAYCSRVLWCTAHTAAGYSETPVLIQSTRRYFPVGHMLDETFRTSNVKFSKASRPDNSRRSRWQLEVS
jgi:hypothetical protein